MKKSVTIDLGIDATTTKYFSVPGLGDLKWRITDQRIVPDASLAVHASNHWTIATAGSDGAAAVSGWTSNSTGGSALTAGVAVQVAIAGSLGTAGEINMSTGQSFKITATKAGTPADFAGRLHFELEAVA